MIYIYVYIPCDSKGLLIILCVYLLLRVCEHKLRHPYALHQSFDISFGHHMPCIDLSIYLVGASTEEVLHISIREILSP